jgi:hypothetical protein
MTTLKIEKSFDGHEYMIRTEQVGMNVFLHPAHPVTNTRIVVLEFDSPLIFHDERKAYSRKPELLSKREYHFDYQGAYGWCWLQRASEMQFLTTHQLEEQIIKRALDLHERFEKGEITRTEWPRSNRGTPWS